MKALRDLATGEISDAHRNGTPQPREGKEVVDIPSEFSNTSVSELIDTGSGVRKKTQQEKDDLRPESEKRLEALSKKPTLTTQEITEVLKLNNLI